MTGPLEGARIIEIEGLGPGPLAGMILADMGAEVIVISRVSQAGQSNLSVPGLDPQGRGKKSVALDLKNPDGIAALLRLIDTADVLIDPFRPGVAERLGFGPETCLARNPNLVFGRMTGWGQTGPMADRAGHDINYISLAGVLAHVGLKGQRPTPPLNLAGDFGGGSMFLITGILAAMLHVANGGGGQVVDAAMVDGAATLMAPLYAAHSTGFWSDDRGSNFLDTGTPFYDTYECSDGGYISVGALEPQFYAELLDGLGLDPESLPDQNDPGGWDEIRTVFTNVIKTKTRDEWAGIFAERDACVAPILTMGESPAHPHNAERNAFSTIDGVAQPNPAPRFSLTQSEIGGPPFRPGEHTSDVLCSVGLTDDDVAELIASGAAAQSS